MSIYPLQQRAFLSPRQSARFGETSQGGLSKESATGRSIEASRVESGDGKDIILTKPGLNALQTNFVIDLSNSYALDINGFTMSFRPDFFSLAEGNLVQLWGEICIHLLIESNIIILHYSPVSPLEGNHRGSRVYLQNLPSESRHHALERLVAGVKVRGLWAIEIIGSNDRVVRPDLEHVFCGLGWASVDGKGVVRSVDSSPVFNLRLEAGFDFPIFH